MKKSFATWRLSFASIPDTVALDSVKSLLEPVSRVEKPADYAMIQREYGLSDHLFIESQAEITAGELALNCLVKAHRLGVGWRIMWPSFPKESASGWSQSEWNRAALPESLSGLTGGFEKSGLFAKTQIPGLEAASFAVTIVDETDETVSKVRQTPATPTEQVASLSPEQASRFASQIAPKLMKLLMDLRSIKWEWDVAGAKEQIQKLGYKSAGEGYEELLFTGADGGECKLSTEGESVRWIEFVISSFHDPHLLDENEFSAKQNEFEAMFHFTVKYASALLGKPVFNGASGEAGFPTDQWADWAAVWNIGGQRLMMQQKHNDPELPLELCLVFAP